MFELIRIAIAIVGSTAAGLWDLKTSDIPDWICVLMAVAGLVLFGAEGFLTGNWSGMTMSLVIGGIFAAFGIGMYFTGQWGGGDGELLVAIGVLLPIWPFSHLSIFPLPVALFINIFLVGAIYTVAYAGVLAYIRPELRRTIARGIDADSHKTVPLTLGAFVAAIILWSLTGAAWPMLIPIAILALPPLYRMLKEVEGGFYKRISTKKLRVDDMIGENIPKLGLNKRHIRGLTAAEVRAIRKLKSYVTVRDGVRFGAVFPLALVLTLLVGDIVTFILPHLM
jgi:Flp pilus assembly protein protease CpaA